MHGSSDLPQDAACAISANADMASVGRERLLITNSVLFFRQKLKTEKRRWLVFFLHKQTQHCFWHWIQKRGASVWFCTERKSDLISARKSATFVIHC